MLPPHGFWLIEAKARSLLGIKMRLVKVHINSNMDDIMFNDCINVQKLNLTKYTVTTATMKCNLTCVTFFPLFLWHIAILTILCMFRLLLLAYLQTHTSNNSEFGINLVSLRFISPNNISDVM